MNTQTTSYNNSTQSKQEERFEKARSVLEQGLHHVTHDREALAAYLCFRAHFRSFSPRNTLMILMQRPSARYCMGYRQWQQHGRQVKKGESGLMIWIPLLRKPSDEEIEDGADPDRKVLRGWRIGYVFAYEQTTATGPDALEYASPIPQLEGDGFSCLYDDLLAVADAFGFTVDEEEGIVSEGYCSHARRHIGIRAGMTIASKAATLAHELAHAIAHQPAREGSSDGEADKGESSDGEPARSRLLRKEARELQAEGAAFLACAALGLDTAPASLPYLKHYETCGETVDQHLQEIDRIAWAIVDAVQ